MFLCRSAQRRVLLLTAVAGFFGCSSNTSSDRSQVGGAPSIGGTGTGSSTSSIPASGGALAASGGVSSSVSGGSSASGGTSNSATPGTGGYPTGGMKNTGGSFGVISGGTKNTGGVSSTGGANSSATGGTQNAVGGSSASSGGGSTTGGFSTAITGGTKGTGGSPASSGGASVTGGSAAIGGSAATGGASAIPTGLPATCGTTNCDNATPVNPQLTSYGALGNVTRYSDGASTGGACLYGNTSIMYYGAINVNLSPGDAKGQWQGGKICGQCFEVTVVTSKGYKSVVVRVTDKCPDGQCGMDLGGSAPAAVMVDGIGRYQGAWRAVSCAGHPEVSDGVPSIHVKDGASAGWSVIQVRNPVMAVAGIDYKSQSNGAIAGSMSLYVGIENYYQVPNDVLASFSTIDITVRYVDGSTAKASLSAAQLAVPESTYPLN